MNNYKFEMEELYEDTYCSETSVETEKISVENINSVPNITGRMDEETKIDLGSVVENEQLYLQQKKVLVKTYRLKK